MRSYKSFRSALLQDATIREHYDALESEFVVIRLLTELRIRRGLSQRELASKVGTKQSAISRFESGTYNPTLDFLHKIAHALDARLKVSLF